MENTVNEVSDDHSPTLGFIVGNGETMPPVMRTSAARIMFSVAPAEDNSRLDRVRTKMHSTIHFLGVAETR